MRSGPETRVDIEGKGAVACVATYEGAFGLGMGVPWRRYVKYCRCYIAKGTVSRSFISSILFSGAGTNF